MLFKRDEASGIKQALFAKQRYQPDHADIDVSQLGGGLGWAAGADENQWAINYFRDFPEHLEKFTDQQEEFFIGPWVVERLADPFDRRDYNDGPKIAVSFQLYYGAYEIGLVRFSPRSWLAKETDQIKEAAVFVEIEYAPLLPYDHVFSFLMLVSEVICYDREDVKAEDRHRQTLRSMQEVLWEAQRQGEVSTTLEFAYWGNANLSRPLRHD